MSLLSRKTGLIIYLVLLMFHLFVLKTSKDIHKQEVNDEASQQFMREMKMFEYYFFTGWNFVMQIFFIAIAIADDLAIIFNMPIRTRKILNHARSWLFSCLVMPVAFMVFIIFWIIFTIDRNLIFPERIDAFFPLWLNHAVHSYIVVVPIVELCLPKSYNFITFKSGFITLSTYLITYQTLYMSVYFRYGVWLYLVYANLTWPQRILLTVAKYSSGIMFLKIGIMLQNTKRKSKLK